MDRIAAIRQIEDALADLEAGEIDLPSATRAVAAVGGLAAVESLAADLARDRRALSRLPVAPDDLCTRLEAVDLDLEAFARLAQTESRRS